MKEVDFILLKYKCHKKMRQHKQKVPFIIAAERAPFIITH